MMAISCNVILMVRDVMRACHVLVLRAWAKLVPSMLRVGIMMPSFVK